MLVLHFEDDERIAARYRAAFARADVRYERLVFPPDDLVAAVGRLRPTVILMDVNLPRMNGFLASRVLKKDLRTSSIPIIGLSNVRGDGVTEEARMSGMDEYWQGRKEDATAVVTWLCERYAERKTSPQ